jgi:hypothetical protein
MQIAVRMKILLVALRKFWLLIALSALAGGELRAQQPHPGTYFSPSPYLGGAGSGSAPEKLARTFLREWLP